MLHRRSMMLMLPALAATVPGSGRAAGHVAWHRDVSELRFAASGPDAVLLADALHRRLGVPVRAVRAQSGALARELDRGHVEFALLDRATLSATRARMHRRLLAGPIRPDGRILVMRSVLSRTMRTDLVAAVAAALA